jgi:hypothetical protein
MESEQYSSAVPYGTHFLSSEFPALERLGGKPPRRSRTGLFSAAADGALKLLLAQRLFCAAEGGCHAFYFMSAYSARDHTSNAV